jgi:hypothetical protein
MGPGESAKNITGDYRTSINFWTARTTLTSVVSTKFPDTGFAVKTHSGKMAINPLATPTPSIFFCARDRRTH